MLGQLPSKVAHRKASSGGTITRAMLANGSVNRMQVFIKGRKKRPFARCACCKKTLLCELALLATATATLLVCWSALLAEFRLSFACVFACAPSSNILTLWVEQPCSKHTAVQWQFTRRTRSLDLFLRPPTSPDDAQSNLMLSETRCVQGPPPRRCCCCCCCCTKTEIKRHVV